MTGDLVKHKKTNVALYFGWIVSIALVAWAITVFDLSAIGEAFTEADYRWLVPAVLMSLAIPFIRAWRWLFLLAHIKLFSYRTSLSATCIGAMANMLAPARAGDFVKTYIFAKKEGISKSSVLGTVVFESISEGLMMAVVIVALMFTVTPPPDKVVYWESFRLAGGATCIVFAGALVLIYLLYLRVHIVELIIDKTMSILPGALGERVADLLDRFREGFDAVGSLGRFISINMLSLAVILLSVIFNYMVLRAFGLGYLPVAGYFLVTVSQVVGAMAPSAPGAFGTFHAATIAALLFYGVAGEVALSVAIIAHAVASSTQILLGFVSLWMGSYSFKEIQNASG